MPPKVTALVFVLLGCISSVAFVRDLGRGVASDRIYTFARATQPIGYAAVMFGKLLIAAFGVAELLFILGLVGDPFLAVRRVMISLGLG